MLVRMSIADGLPSVLSLLARSTARLEMGNGLNIGLYGLILWADIGQNHPQTITVGRTQLDNKRSP